MGEIRKYGKHKYWTQEEMDLLKRLCRTKTKSEIAKIMKRTESSISSKRKELGIESCHQYMDKMKCSEVAILVGQNKSNIYKTWKNHGFPIKRKGYYWYISEEELISFMQENPRLWKASQCDYWFFSRYDWFLDRLQKEKNGKDEVNHYRNIKRWTAYELSLVKMYWKRGMNNSEIAEKIGRSYMAVYHKVRLLEEEAKGYSHG